jgi:hypothetical protein
MSGDILQHQLRCDIYVVQYLDYKGMWIQVGPEFASNKDAVAKYELLCKCYVNVRIVLKQEKIWRAVQA